MICGVHNEDILKEIDKNQIFQAICKIKNIDYNEIISNLIERIKDSEVEDKDVYISEQEIWDSEDISIIREEDILFIDESLLWDKEEAINFFKGDFGDETEDILDELWIETTNEEKEVIQIAQECKIREIRIEAMR